MTWTRAVEDTLEHWYGIRDSIGLVSDLELLTGIHAACALCEKATDQASETTGDPLKRCDFCLLAQQFGVCYGIGGEMSERIVEHDLEALTDLVDEFIARLEAVRLPMNADDERSERVLERYVELL